MSLELLQTTTPEQWTPATERAFTLALRAALAEQRTVRFTTPCPDAASAAYWRQVWERIHRHNTDVFHTGGSTYDAEVQLLRWTFSTWPRPGDDDFEDFVRGGPVVTSEPVERIHWMYAQITTVASMTPFDKFVEGHVAQVIVTLFANGSAIDASTPSDGWRPSLLLRDRDGGLVSLQGTVDWANASLGAVRYVPSFKDLKASRSPCTARFVLTGDAGDTVVFPNGDALIWTVRQ